jgi:hypothetical protein
MSVDFPPTVASGHGGGGGGNGTMEGGTPDASEDTGFEGDGGTASFICSIGGATPTGTCTVYVDVPSDIAPDLENAPNGCAASGQVLTSGDCGSTVISCCLETIGTYQMQTCYYSTPPSCAGTVSSTQTLQL